MKNHTAEPIRDKEKIKSVEQYLKRKNKRNYVIWELGINSGLRVSDILRLNVSDVADKTHITIIEKITKKRKSFYINDKLKKILKRFIRRRKGNGPLFLGKHGKRLNQREVYRFIVRVCSQVGIESKVSTHTMRKTFGYHHYQKYKDVVLLQKIFNHSSSRITLMYLGITQDEIDFSYKNFEL